MLRGCRGGVFVIANNAVGLGWDGITGSAVRVLLPLNRDYVPGLKRTTRRFEKFPDTGRFQSCVCNSLSRSVMGFFSSVIGSCVHAGNKAVASCPGLVFKTSS